MRTVCAIALALVFAHATHAHAQPAIEAMGCKCASRPGHHFGMNWQPGQAEAEATRILPQAPTIPENWKALPEKIEAAFLVGGFWGGLTGAVLIGLLFFNAHLSNRGK